MIDEKIEFIRSVFREASAKVNKVENGWWPRYLYHYSNIDNICSILESQYIYSRVNATSLGIMSNENANEAVLLSTNENIKNMVRFYFRPLTKTQLSNEGFKSELSGKSKHVPTPVFLFIDILSVFLLPDVSFTDKHPLNTYHKVFSEISDLEFLDFEAIYHDGAYQSSDYVRSCRQAEVWVPDSLPTTHIRQICVRSMADKEFLIYSLFERDVLNDLELREIEDKILVKKTLNVFFNHGTHIDNVELSDERINVTLNNQWACREVKMSAFIYDGINKYQIEWTIGNTKMYTSNFNYRSSNYNGSFLVEVFFDETLMYKNELYPIQNSLVY